MKILFSVQNLGFLRNFQSTVAMLAEHGHTVHIIADRADSVGGTKLVDGIPNPDGRITYEIVKPPKRGPWISTAMALRLTIDYWRYLEPQFADAVQLRARAEDHVPRIVVLLPKLPLLGTSPGRHLLMWLARTLEAAVPPRADVEKVLKTHKPDVLLLTPLLYFGSKQVDYVRAARQLRIPSILGVGSWDHLTTKGLIHEIPDRIVVWNEMQRTEASALHGVPASQVEVTGAQAYDHWFARTVSTTREAFCARVGLPAGRPFLLYLCSSPFIAPHEVPSIRRWIEAVRGSHDPRIRELGLLIRPHPQNADQWKDVDLSQYGDVAIWPRAGANPIDADARAEYYDSMYHSHAVVGVNTSALIESGIVGRRVFSLLVEEFSGTQEGTLHFQHLKNVEGGLLQLASSLDEHLSQVAQTLDVDAAHGASQVRRFVQAFVRPHGLDVAATPRVVDAIERAATIAVVPKPDSITTRLARLVLTPIDRMLQTRA